MKQERAHEKHAPRKITQCSSQSYGAHGKLPGQWLGKEIRMLQVRRHMLNLKLSPSYTLPDEVVADVDVLGPWGGTRVIVGHAKSTHPC